MSSLFVMHDVWDIIASYRIWHTVVHTAKPLRPDDITIHGLRTGKLEMISIMDLYSTVYHDIRT